MMLHSWLLEGPSETKGTERTEGLVKDEGSRGRRGLERKISLILVGIEAKPSPSKSLELLLVLPASTPTDF